MRTSLLSLVALVFAGVPAGAQTHPQTREGFWISFGLGSGSLTVNDGCRDCLTHAYGTSVYARMGGTLSQRLLLGGEVNNWTHSGRRFRGGRYYIIDRAQSIGPVVLFYPNPTGAFFLKGGLAVAWARFIDPAFPPDHTENGMSLTLGVGWDARVGRTFALTPFIDILSASFDPGSFTNLTIGLGFTWP
jgi:hypothetical protein